MNNKEWILSDTAAGVEKLVLVGHNFLEPDFGGKITVYLRKIFTDANGHGLIISNSTGDIIIDQSTFKLANTSANYIYASASRTIKASNNTMIGATTPINANVTIAASTDLGNGNRQI
jgi:hypothetical protein